MEAKFSGEECLGKYLDLNVLYLEFSNIKGVQPMKYLNFLDRFDRFKDIDKSVKAQPEYFSFLSNLCDYLFSWITKAQPLFNVEGMNAEMNEKFETLWNDGVVPNWEREHAPMLNPELYCIPCDKHFAKATVFESHKTGKKHLKACELKNDSSANASEKLEESLFKTYEKNKPIAFTEYKIVNYMKHLSEIREDTKAHIERKQALTDKERVIFY